MECFKHTKIAAVGICKSCYKAVCKDCAIEVPHGLACSPECAIEVNESNQAQERSKTIYGIGKRKSRIPSSGVILWSLFAVVMWALFLFPYLVAGKVLYENLVMAILFTVIAGIAFYSARRTGLQC